MTAIVDFLNSILWGYVLVYGLLAVGIFFTIRLGFLQFVNFGEMVRAIRGSRESDVHGISPFQALCTSLASRVGTGNLAGVAVALYLGGAGAIFWMWMVALVGMATGYAESTLAQLYKVRDGKGQYRGGPAWYIAKGLKAPWAAAIFAVCLIISFGLVFNAVQANSIADAMEGAFGAPKLGVGVVIAALAGIVIFGGLRKIVRFAEFVVPFMAGAYVLLALVVMALNITEVPGILAMIVKSAFGLEEAAGGAAGSITAAMLNGIKRGLFSNEAGMGSAPNIAATATPAPHHPSSQGLVQAFGVFIDTIIICTATAVMILLAGVLEPGSGITGTQLTQQAMEVHLGDFGGYFIAVAILFFAFTSIVANYTYAENALIYLKGGNTLGLTLLRVAALAMVIWGGYEAVVTVFNAADASMGLMAAINLVAIVLLSGTVAKLTKDYLAQRKEGLVPHFKSKDYPELHEKIDSNIWH
ncbi:alanine/glycine:cation symporter family protein [Marinobacter shengliensis]